MQVLAIIQARSSSTRLPGKVLMKIEDKTMLEHVCDRVLASKLVDEVLVATTMNRLDLAIIKLCAEKGIRVYAGSENDVLDRFYQVAKIIKPANILRITADCPIVDPANIDKVIAEHLKSGADYTGNTVGKETYPDGQDSEIFTFEALKKSWKEAVLASEREHVTQYIKKNDTVFKIVGVESKVDLSEHRWTVDGQEDLDFIREVNRELYPKDPVFSMEEVLNLLKTKPQLSKINYHIERNAGLKKSVDNDEVAVLDDQNHEGL